MDKSEDDFEEESDDYDTEDDEEKDIDDDSDVFQDLKLLLSSSRLRGVGWWGGGPTNNLSINNQGGPNKSR